MDKTKQLERTVSTRILPEAYERLEQLAAIDRRTVGNLVRIAIEQYLNRRKATA